jgi:Flp pilus assembly protein TadD
MPSLSQRLALAIQHHESGRLDDAEALYRDILREAPQQPHALHLLGVRVMQAGRHPEAIDLIGRAVAVDGSNAAFHSNLALAYLNAGLLTEAETHCREALQLQPNFPDVLSNLGLVLRAKGQLAAAADVLCAAARLQPRFADAFSNLGLVMLDQGRRDEAANAFREALRLEPNHADARRNLDALQTPKTLAEVLVTAREAVRRDPENADSQSELGHLLLGADQAEEALPHLQEALRLKSGDAEARRRLGLAWQHLHQVDDATHCYREALRLDPSCVAARNNLAIALQAQGHLDEATREFTESLRIAPDNSQAIYSLSELSAAGRFRFPAEEIGRIQQLAARAELAIDDRCRLNFALCQLFDRSGECDKAFAHARRANELRQEIDRRCGVVFDPAAHQQWVDRICDTFTPDYFTRIRSFGVDSELPIFIVGMPRSGTSLAEQIVASHPQVHGAGELSDIARLCATVLPQRLSSAEAYPQYVASLDAATARELGERHLQRLQALSGEAVRVVDKSPLNFLYLGVIATLFPQTRIIHCRRDARDTCLSCYCQNFATTFAFKTDLRQLARYYRDYERLMAHWSRVLPLPVFELCYEKLTAEPEKVTRRLIEFCGLEWDDRCLRFHETRRAVWTASMVQVRQPMSRGSVGRWSRYAAHLQPLLDELG